MDIFKAAARVAGVPDGAMAFTGAIRSFYDGENTEGEGVLEAGGLSLEVSFSGSASARGAEYLVGGKQVDPSSRAQEALDALFEDLWPDAGEPAWEAEVVRNEVVSRRVLADAP